MIIENVTGSVETPPLRLGERQAPDVPVFAFGSGVTALGVLRSLRRAGFPVYSVCPAGELPTKSRWYRPAPLDEREAPTPDRLPEYLSSSPVSRAVLIPCSDDWAKAISKLDSPLKERFPASISCPRVVEMLTDKWRFASVLESLEVPRPRSALLRSFDEARALPEANYENMFLKPIDSQEFSRCHSVKAFRLRNKNHAMQILAGLQATPSGGFPVLLQEYVPGPVSNYILVDGFVDRDGRICALIARRRQSQYPAWFGNSSRSETILLHEVPGAVAILEKLLAALPYRGIFDAEFKYDERDGQLKILEINARPWWFVEFADRCGVDLCAMSYRDALGLAVEPVRNYDTGRCCVYLGYDFAAHCAADPGVKGILRWVRSCIGVEDIIFRWNDPKPAIASAASSLKRHLRRLGNRAHERLISKHWRGTTELS